MVYELEQAGKQFDMRLYPGQRHGIRGPTLSVNLYEMMTDFLVHALLSAPQEVSAPDGAWLGR
jgi:dipeptidyl aminopeptidase/acylaminoacyl peptidase